MCFVSEKVEKEKAKSVFREGLILQKSNINDKVANHGAVIYDHGLKLLILEDALRRLDHKIELTEARIYRNMSIKYQNVKPVVTSTRINSEVKCQQEIVELNEQRLDILKSLGLAKLKTNTLAENTKLMQTYSGNVRDERQASSTKKLTN
jgi:hypothetical protein